MSKVKERNAVTMEQVDEEVRIGSLSMTIDELADYMFDLEWRTRVAEQKLENVPAHVPDEPKKKVRFGANKEKKQVLDTQTGVTYPSLNNCGVNVAKAEGITPIDTKIWYTVRKKYLGTGRFVDPTTMQER